MESITIIGLGYVGLTTALVFANAGFNAICIDKDKNKINSLINRKMPFYEKGCNDLLNNNYNKMLFTDNYKKMNNSEIIFICVGTPLNSNGDLDISSLKDVITNIDKQIKNKIKITVCIRSTILPGTCDELQKHLKHSNISIVHNPEFLSQGSALNDFINAKRIVIGSDNQTSLNKIKNLYNKVLKFYNIQTPIVTMKTKDSEMVKFMANSYLAMRISFVNEMSNLCKKVGVNVGNVIEGVKYDERIGDNYFKSGIGYGGSCLPKDTKAILNYSNKKKSVLRLVDATIKINDSQVKWCFNEIKKNISNLSDKKVAILGVTFKAETDDIRNSCSLDLINLFLDEKLNIRVYDPKGLGKLKKIYANKINYYNDIDNCITNCDIIIIATDWNDIKNYDYNSIQTCKNVYIFDFKSCLSIKNKSNKQILYWCFEGYDGK